MNSTKQRQQHYTALNPKLNQLKDVLSSCVYSLPDYPFTEECEYNDLALKEYSATFTSSGKGVIDYPGEFPECDTLYWITDRVDVDMRRYSKMFYVYKLHGEVFRCFAYGTTLMNEPLEPHSVVFIIYRRKIVTSKTIHKPTLYWFQKNRNYQYMRALDGLSKDVTMVEGITLESLKDLYKSRHNVLQMYLCDVYGLDLVLDETLDLEALGIDSRLTPDLFAYDSEREVCLIGDLSVTANAEATRVEKVSKYMHLVHKIEGMGKRCILFMVCLQTATCDIKRAVLTAPLNRVSAMDPEFDGKFLEVVQQFQYIKEKNPEVFTRLHENDIPKGIPFEYKIPSWIKNERMENAKEASRADFDIDKLAELLHEDFALKGDVYTKFADDKFEARDIDSSLLWIHKENLKYPIGIRPTHYIPIPEDNGGLETLYGEFSEQDMILNFLEEVRNVGFPLIAEFSQCVLKSARGVHSETQRHMMNTGEYVPENEMLKKEYHTQDFPGSYYDFLREKLKSKIPDVREPKFVKRKVFQMSMGRFTPQAQEFWLKSGQQYNKHHPEPSSRRVKTTVEMKDGKRTIESFLDCLMKRNSHSKIPPEIYEVNNIDAYTVQNAVDGYKERVIGICHRLESTYAHKYLKHNSLAYEQLIHYANLSMSDSKICMFNTGIPNMLCLMIANYRGMASGIGKPFLCCGIVKDISFIPSSIFGDCHIEEISRNRFFYCTKWRRLPLHRLEFFRDQYYSVLSTTMSTLLRRDIIMDEDVRGVFGLRVITSLVANQSCMEKIADSRYAIMSSFSEYTNFKSLIHDKFAPPYQTAFESWIVQRMLNGLKKFRKQLSKRDAVKVFKPVLDEFSVRSHTSSGGLFNIGALWSDRKLYTIQDILDELFLYVHTPKEPSNIFHEEVAALKTIREYQLKYDRMETREKAGYHGNAAQTMEWLKTNPSMGFSAPVLRFATERVIDRDNPDMISAVNYCMTETLDEIESTKAVIPDARPVSEPVFRTKGETAVRLKKLDHLRKGNHEEDIENFVEARDRKHLEREKRVTQQIRLKVHDMLIKYVEESDNMTLLESGLKFIETREHILVDICIKAQYGSKREFYVMSMGSKVLARIVENFYRHICHASPYECISVPGDQKLMKMQRMMDNITSHAMKNRHQVLYINGDCSKWSASELLEVFYIIADTFHERTDHKYFNLVKTVLSMWSDKHIQVPSDLTQKVAPVTEATSYLEGVYKDGYKLNSTQNFLQGCFNYISSHKADSCQHLVKVMWKKMYPSSRLDMEYLVHSDDYVNAVSYNGYEEFERFRALQKVCMRLCGITDSSKKTNCQHYFMEFISLVSFNGSMSYPTIKKTKEVALTLPCESFKGDSDMVCSRTGECVRIGTDYQSSWFFHRIHMYLLRRAYSLHLGGRNEIQDRFDTPTQMFGQSDCHPSMYFLCKGDPNNIRLFKYGDRIKLSKLVLLAHSQSALAEILDNFATPTFIYNNYNKKILQLRDNTGIDASQAAEFWCENIVYNYYKPREKHKYLEWAKSMYYKTSFVKAYNRDSRSTRMLRLSRFTSRKCVTMLSGEQLHQVLLESQGITNVYLRDEAIGDSLMTIKECYEYLNEQPDDVNETDLFRACLNGDSTAYSMYDWFENSDIIVLSSRHVTSMCASKAPMSPGWLRLSRDVLRHLHYIIDPISYVNDHDKPIDIMLLESDRNEIDTSHPGILDIIKDDSQPVKDRMLNFNLIYNVCVNNMPNTQICMTKRRHRGSLNDFLKDSFKYNSYQGLKCNVVSSYLYSTINPFTLISHSLIGYTPTLSKLRLLLNNLSMAYSALWYRLEYEDKTIQLLRESNYSYNGAEYGICDTLKEHTYESAREEGADRYELMCFGVLKYQLLQDVEPLRQLASSKMDYGAKYHTDQELTTSTGYAGTTKADFNFAAARCYVEYNRDVKEMRITTDNPRPQFGPGIYYTAMRVCGLLSEHELSLKISSNINRLPSKRYTAYTTGMFYTRMDNSFYLKEVKKGDSYIGLPIMVKDYVKHAQILVEQNSLCITTALRVDGIQVFHGFTKLFNMPYHRMSYCSVDIHLDIPKRYGDLINSEGLLVLVDRDTDYSPILYEEYLEAAPEAPDTVFKLDDGINKLLDLQEGPMIMPVLNYNFEIMDNEEEGIIEEDLIGLGIEEDEVLLYTHPKEKFEDLKMEFSVFVPQPHTVRRLASAENIDKDMVLQYHGIKHNIVLSPVEYMVIVFSLIKMADNRLKLFRIIKEKVVNSFLMTGWFDINGSTFRSMNGVLEGYKRVLRSTEFMIGKQYNMTRPELLWNRKPYSFKKAYGDTVEILTPLTQEEIKSVEMNLKFRYMNNYLPGVHISDEIQRELVNAWNPDIEDDL